MRGHCPREARGDPGTGGEALGDPGDKGGPQPPTPPQPLQWGRSTWGWGRGMPWGPLAGGEGCGDTRDGGWPCSSIPVPAGRYTRTRGGGRQVAWAGSGPRDPRLEGRDVGTPGKKGYIWGVPTMGKGKAGGTQGMEGEPWDPTDWGGGILGSLLWKRGAGGPQG